MKTGYIMILNWRLHATENMHELLRKICVYLHLTTVMVDVYETLEGEEFAMSGNLFIFFYHFMEHDEKLFVAEIYFFEMAFCFPKKLLSS